MGSEAKDYYREKYKKSLKDHNYADSDSVNQLPGQYHRTQYFNRLGYLLYSILLIVILWAGVNAFIEYKNHWPSIVLSPEVVSAPVPPHRHPQNPLPITPAIPPEAIQNPPAPVIMPKEEVRIRADKQGHYRGIAMINNVPMPFLIDTGATKTVIPEIFAASARLPYGRYIQANTAGGMVSERETTIEVLKIGNIVIHNLDAAINTHLNEVLIGMNTLRYFYMSQNSNILTLIPNKQLAPVSTVTSNRLVKKPTIIKKTIICNKKNVCITKYSDH